MRRYANCILLLLLINSRTTRLQDQDKTMGTKQEELKFREKRISSSKHRRSRISLEDTRTGPSGRAGPNARSVEADTKGCLKMKSMQL
jgi:hypothetical protein